MTIITQTIKVSTIQIEIIYNLIPKYKCFLKMILDQLQKMNKKAIKKVNLKLIYNNNNQNKIKHVIRI